MPSGSIRRALAAVLDRVGLLCTRAGVWCLYHGELLAPDPAVLTPAAADRILVNVMTAIGADSAFHPSDCDRAVAVLAQQVQRTLYIAETPWGVIVAAGSRREGRAS